jgi:acyl-CoA dehydrogenase
MTAELRLDHPVLPPDAARLRREVRAFIAEERASGRLPPPSRLGMGFSPETSQRIAARGWIGLTWPRDYGGGARTALERYVVTEELLAASVPVGAHWVADRQSGPVLLKFGTEAQKREYLPRIAAGACYFCIGMSEPAAGSDLASLTTKATRVEGGGWRIRGRKVWTTNAHRVHYMIVLARTSPAKESRHEGLSQFIVDLTAPGVTVGPIVSMAGEHDFNEVLLDDVAVSDDALIGREGNGWNQVSAELAYERSGPERWLSSFRLIAECAAALDDTRPDTREALGRLLSHLLALRQLSLSVAGMIQAGEAPNVEAAIVKDLGTKFEQEAVRVIRDIVAAERLTDEGRQDRLKALLRHAQTMAPAFTIRGGTNEILRGLIARGLGLR